MKACETRLPKALAHGPARLQREAFSFTDMEIENETSSFPYGELLKATVECSRGVAWKDSVLKWRIPSNHLLFCARLKRKLDNRTYKQAPYSEFFVTEPKRRMIKSPLFCDRVVQRAMCNMGVYHDLTKGNVYDNAACQNGKGTMFAIDRLKCFLERFWRRHGNRGWAAKLDIHQFFDSIVHDALMCRTRGVVMNSRFVELISRCVDSFGRVGLGLGSQLSQLLAIFMLSPIDHLAKERLGCRYYLRYSDDIVILHESRERLVDIVTVIRDELAKIGLRLNPKSCVFPLKHGIVFMKWRFRLTCTGGVTMRKRRKAVSRYARYIRRRARLGASEEDMEKSFNSWKSHIEKGNSRITIGKIRRTLECQM